MNSQYVETRRLGLSAAACALISTLLIAAAIPLNERAVALENGITGHEASYAVGLALLLALVAGGLSLRFGLNPSRGLLEAAVVAAVLAALAAAGAGLLVAIEPVATQIQVCLAGHDVWLAAYTGPTPDSCGNPGVPESEFGYFYPAMYASWAAGALFLVSIILLVRAGGRRSAPLPPRAFEPTRARRLRLAASACAVAGAVVLVVALVIGGFALSFLYPAALGVALATAAACTAFYSAAMPERRGVSATITLASLSAVFAVISALGFGPETPAYVTLAGAAAAAVGFACVGLMVAARRYSSARV